MTYGYRIKTLSIHKAIRIRRWTANRNPTPRHVFERRMVELKKRIEALNIQAHDAGIREP